MHGAARKPITGIELIESSVSLAPEVGHAAKTVGIQPHPNFVVTGEKQTPDVVARNRNRLLWSVFTLNRPDDFGAGVADPHISVGRLSHAVGRPDRLTGTGKAFCIRGQGEYRVPPNRVFAESKVMTVWRHPKVSAMVHQECLYPRCGIS